MRYEVAVTIEQSWSLVVEAENTVTAQTMAVSLVSENGQPATASEMHIEVSKGVDGR